MDKLGRRTWHRRRRLVQTIFQRLLMTPAKVVEVPVASWARQALACHHSLDQLMEVKVAKWES